MEITVDRPEQDQTITATVGDSVRIVLPENPTTGYRWQFDDITPDVIALVRSEYLGPGSPAVGAGGTRVIVIAAQKSGRVRLELRNARLWQSQLPVAQKVQYVINVR